MKPIANRARSVDVIREAADRAVAGDSGGLGASSHRARTDLGACNSRCCRDKSSAFASNFMYFLDSGKGGAVTTSATVLQVEPLQRFSIGAVRREAVRRSVWPR